MTLDGKRIVVVGGSSGIGLAVAQAASREGAGVVVVSSSQGRVAEALATLPRGAEGHAADVTNEAAVAALFDRLGPIDHLVYTAGEALTLGSLASVDLAASRRAFDVRYWGAYAAAKYASPGIRTGGSIVFSSGTAGRRPRAGWSVVASICMAMEGLTRALAVELAPIRVNLVVPGLVRTPLWDTVPDSERAEMYEQGATTLPVGHVGEPDEVAQSYLYLMRQSYGTGQAVIVDGGGLLA